VALLDVVNMSDAQREQRRELDEAAFLSVEAYCGSGTPRTKAITKAAGSLGMKRNDVIAGYWRHVRREQAAPAPRRRKVGR
jgi:hypothetical protein